MNETIINGIDVSECEHHYTNLVNGTIYHGCAIYEQINELGYSQDTLCEQNPDCYFKQFKRLQQELDIKEKMLDKFMIGSGETLEKLQKENEKLKEQLNIYTSQYEIKIPNKYEQALEEIRGMLKKSMSLKSNAYNHFINVEKAIDKINEVLNDRD